MKNNKVDFNGQEISVGLDVHKEKVIVNTYFKGITLGKFRTDPICSQLVKRLKKEYPGAKIKCVYEAGFSGFSLQRQLQQAGIECIVVNPADVPTKHKEKDKKTDKVDAKKLARELSKGNLDAIYIPTPEQESLRALNRLRYQLGKDERRVKNRIISLLDFLGIQELNDGYWSNRYIQSLCELPMPFATSRLTLDGLIEELKFLRSEIAKTVKKLRSSINGQEYSRKIINNLISVPGVGFIIASTFYTEIMDIYRFKRLAPLSAYIGLSPSTDSSGEKERIKGLSKRQNRILRYMLIEAAWTAIRRDPALLACYGQLCKRMKGTNAIIRIAKKLLNRLMFVWKNEQNYVLSVVE
jgi:transposase